MGILESRIDRTNPEFQENSKYFQQLLEQLNQRIQQVQQGGGTEAIARHRKRNKLLARERVQLLCDPNTPFLELSPLAAWDGTRAWIRVPCPGELSITSCPPTRASRSFIPAGRTIEAQ